MLNEDQRTIVNRIGEPIRLTEKVISFVNRNTSARLDKDSQLYLIGFVYPNNLFLKDFQAGWTVEVTMEEFAQNFQFEPIPFHSFLQEIDTLEGVRDVEVEPSSSDTVCNVSVVLKSGPRQSFRVTLDDLSEARANIFSWIEKSR